MQLDYNQGNDARIVNYGLEMNTLYNQFYQRGPKGLANIIVGVFCSTMPNLADCCICGGIFLMVYVGIRPAHSECDLSGEEPGKTSLIPELHQRCSSSTDIYVYHVRSHCCSNRYAAFPGDNFHTQIAQSNYMWLSGDG